MIRAGLTGGIASGKSTVARMLQQAGIPVLDADLVARAVVEPGTPAFQDIVAHFGPSVISPGGDLDRDVLRRLIVSSSAERLRLEGMTHPRIRAAIGEWLSAQQASGHAAAVVEAALLVETGTYKEYDLLIVVQCDEDTQLCRLMKRSSLTRAEAIGWIEAQLPVAEKARLADILIRNDGDLINLENSIEGVIQRLVQGHSPEPPPSQ